MKSSIQTRSSRGFTLLEIMFALALLGMIIAAVYSSWMIIVRGSKVGLDAAAMVQRSRMAMHTIENALTCARAFAGDVEYYSFLAENGDDASLSFVARLPAAFPRGGKFGDCYVRRVTFSLEPGPDFGRRLVLRQSPVLLEPDKDEMEHPVVLAKNVKEFSMQFWDKKEGFVDEWTKTNTLPQMVWITLEFTGSDPHSTVRSEVSRLIALSSVMVQPGWQMPGYNGGPAANRAVQTGSQ